MNKPMPNKSDNPPTPNAIRDGNKVCTFVGDEAEVIMRLLEAYTPQSVAEHIFSHNVGGTTITCTCGKTFGTSDLARQHQEWHLQKQASQSVAIDEEAIEKIFKWIYWEGSNQRTYQDAQLNEDRFVGEAMSALRQLLNTGASKK